MCREIGNRERDVVLFSRPMNAFAKKKEEKNQENYKAQTAPGKPQTELKLNDQKSCHKTLNTTSLPVVYTLR